MRKLRSVLFYGNNFIQFYLKQNSKTQKKIEFVLDMVRYERIVPVKFFKYLRGTDGLYEIRVKVRTQSIRILCFYDKGNIVVLNHAFYKKTQKTPQKEIDKAAKLRKEYFKTKNKNG